jgi:transcription elongation factor SPT6
VRSSSLATQRRSLIFFCSHLHESQNLANTAAGGKTPYGGRTPGRTPAGGATPGRMSVRQPAGRTPNPYGATPATSGGGWAPIPPVPPFGGPPASLPTPAQGFQTPAYTAPVPAGMNPERARMLQRNGGGW